MHFFQKHNTTAAFKIAGGADLGPNRQDSKQRQVPAVFTSKISKTFLDSLYAFLDGLAHLASPEYTFTQALARSETRGKPNPISAPVDLTNVVSRSGVNPSVIINLPPGCSHLACAIQSRLS